MIQLPNNEKCYSLPEQVAQNLLNIQYLAEQYKNIDELPAIWQSYKETFDAEQETFAGWTTTFEGWDTTLATYLVNMSSAAVSAIAGQNIAPGAVAATGKITAPEIVETMTDYVFIPTAEQTGLTREFIYAGIVKNGNKLTLVIALNLTRTGTAGSNQVNLGVFGIPAAIGAKIYSTDIGGETWCASQSIDLVKDINGSNPSGRVKISAGSTSLSCYLRVADINNTLTLNDKHYVRAEITFLLSDNLAA